MNTFFNRDCKYRLYVSGKLIKSDSSHIRLLDLAKRIGGTFTILDNNNSVIW